LDGAEQPTVAAAAQAPMSLGRLGRVQGAAIRGQYAYVSAGDWNVPQQLHVFDISNPFRPTRTGSIELPGAGRVILHGDYACVLAASNYQSTGGLYLVNITDPTQLHLVSSLSVPTSGDIAFNHDYAYLSIHKGQQSEGEFWVVDLSRPDQPWVTGTVKMPDARGVAVAGRYALVIAGKVGFSWSSLPRPSGLRVVDVSNPRQPKLVASLDLGDAQAIAVAGRYAYIAVQETRRQASGLQVVDISDPVRPKQVSSFAMPTPEALEVRDGYVYVLGGSSGIQVISVVDPRHLHPQGRLDVPFGGAVDGTVSDGYGYLFTYYGGLVVIDLTDPAKPVRLGTLPSAETMGYMKRRARRFMRTLAERDSDLYAQMAYRVLTESGKGRSSLDLANQWVSADILFGASERYMQRRHGRGSYAMQNPRFRLKTREERAPEAWDRRPDLARKLYEAPDLPWQTQESALRMLRAAGAEIPALKKRHLTRFLQSPSPLLISTATGQIAAMMDAGTDLDAAVVADAYYGAGARLRRSMQARLPGYVTSAAWSRTFATRLFERIAGALHDGRLSGRQAGIAVFLAEEFSDEISSLSLLNILAPLLASGRRELTEWALRAVRQAPADAAISFLQALEPLREEQREPALEALLHGIRERSLDFGAARALVQSSSAWIRETGWQLLAASATDQNTLRQLWMELLDSEGDSAVLRTAMASSAALASLDHARIEPEWLATRLRDRPFLVGLLSAGVFARVAGTVPATLTVQLIAAANDEQWAALRRPLLDSLHNVERLRAFWKAVWAALEQEPQVSLQGRVLHDAAITTTFSDVDNAAFEASFLRTDDPQFGSLLRDWLSRHENEIEKDNSLLLSSATHPVAEVRDWGLARVRRVGMSMPFALRLLEAELPPSVALGKEFFDAVKPGTDEEMDYALALCDSPQKSVRAYGQQYVGQRLSTLLRDVLLRRLFENPNPEIQAFVALLLLHEESPPTTEEFNREVLRARNRGRVAKELVKKRIDGTATIDDSIDVATLLEMARSRTPRDAEWALSQLAHLALEGREIEGLYVEGVASV
jgi:hypothetical protein